MLGVPFAVICGVRQGGILSPFLFAIYVDDLTDRLRCSGYGFHIGAIFIGHTHTCSFNEDLTDASLYNDSMN